MYSNPLLTAKKARGRHSAARGYHGPIDYRVAMAASCTGDFAINRSISYATTLRRTGNESGRRGGVRDSPHPGVFKGGLEADTSERILAQHPLE